MIKNRKLFAVLMVAMLLVSGAMGVYATKMNDTLPLGPYQMDCSLQQSSSASMYEFRASTYISGTPLVVNNYRTFIDASVSVIPYSSSESVATAEASAPDMGFVGCTTQYAGVINAYNAYGNHNALIIHYTTGASYSSTGTTDWQKYN